MEHIKIDSEYAIFGQLTMHPLFDTLGFYPLQTHQEHVSSRDTFLGPSHFNVQKVVQKHKVLCLKFLLQTQLKIIDSHYIISCDNYFIHINILM